MTPDGSNMDFIVAKASDIASDVRPANARYIAAANPAVVLKLIDMCRCLHWTTEKPTKPDYYWHKDDSEDGLLDIAYIYGDQDSGMFCYFAGEKEPTLLDLVTGEWAGPIPEPKELKDD